MADSIVAAIQAKYDALTAFTGKPPVLWPGVVLPKNPDGTAVTYPVVKFEHQGTDRSVFFTHCVIETHRFLFEIFAETGAQAETIYDRMMLNGYAPDAAGANGGLWYPTTLAVPTKMVFMSMIPLGPWTAQEVVGTFTGAAVTLNRLWWQMAVQVERVTWS